MSTTGRADEVAEVCRRAEATGADSLWAVDHLYWPHPIGEALTTLAVAAVTTTRPVLGTCVLQLPLRPSSVVAKQATALQHLSDGRFVLGMGVGIHEHEYVRAGVDYHRRGHLMDEGVAAAGGNFGERRQPDVGQSEVGRQRGRLDDVVAMLGSCPGLERRRQVQMRDPEIAQIRNPPFGVGEAEVRGQLQAIGGAERSQRIRPASGS